MCNLRSGVEDSLQSLKDVLHLTDLGEAAGGEVEEGAGAAVHRLLGDPALGHAGLHRGLAGRHVQHCKYQMLNI